MTNTATQSEKEDTIADRFIALPQSVQDAITDADVEKKLRKLAAKHKLHLDQWVLLENEIMFSILGLADPKDMAKNIAREVHIDSERAQKLVDEIALQIFQPIHQLLQEELSEKHPKRKIGNEKESIIKNTSTMQKNTPSDTSSYKPGENSSSRTNIQEDPYRENIDD